ncbi:hypothetical protein PPTG_22647 [Phytophthora nicotianae INRA-310]|uniref:Uncharacterized protein n=1 Tax=Phytophthora nicotianae (strain INRA-310) TaxID=761204 RepID=W2QD37_PHYN3|nr:hypothetical protein PPTG_22647 [Phytophthora nicotianae INRA-310]ETN11082.1 hypothetical protein PPTG_22647 [Phytophthora nicotianae INRA-310]
MNYYCCQDQNLLEDATDAKGGVLRTFKAGCRWEFDV